MAQDRPPPAPDLYVFPNSIPGYNLHSKKWVDLKIDSIKDVAWNKEAFEHLVVNSETKELVQALVKHQIASEQSTEIVSRKGNGLIILLHGGPATGKTFTAKSVAEMAEKPLFRVTCGDIGSGTAETGSRKRKAPEEPGPGPGPRPRKRPAREAGPGKATAVMTGINFFEVECYVSELAKHELNGRQIRNVITTARQLASSRGQLIGHSHLQHVIKVSSKFDTYLNKVKEGFSDDQIARGDGVR